MPATPGAVPAQPARAVRRAAGLAAPAVRRGPDAAGFKSFKLANGRRAGHT
jgi:hypothetical protein